jgi:hypothetical protein
VGDNVNTLCKLYLLLRCVVCLPLQSNSPKRLRPKVAVALPPAAGVRLLLPAKGAVLGLP